MEVVHRQLPHKQMKRVLLLSALVFSSIFIYDVITFDLYNVKCSHLLEEIEPPFPAILIDERLLESLSYKSCSKWRQAVHLAVAEQLRASVEPQNYSKYNIIYYRDDPEKNYILFYDSSVRIIPRISFQVHGNLLIPNDTSRFSEFWKRSIFVPCRNITVVRDDQTRYLPVNKSIESMSALISYLTDFDIYPFLLGGTLLGWYRECDIIPHTRDVDFGAFIEEHNPALLEHLLSNDTKFRLTRKLGEPNDSYEFTFRPVDGENPFMDLFWMYTEGNESWVGGTGGGGAKFKYTYPRYRDICAADLLGHIFWITCNPEPMIVAEYGPRWYNDHPSSDFYWSRSHFNVKPNGKWPEEKLANVYRVY